MSLSTLRLLEDDKVEHSRTLLKDLCVLAYLRDDHTARTPEDAESTVQGLTADQMNRKIKIILVWKANTQESLEVVVKLSEPHVRAVEKARDSDAGRDFIRRLTVRSCLYLLSRCKQGLCAQLADVGQSGALQTRC